MPNPNAIIRRLVDIDPLFKPTSSVLLLLHAVELIGVELSQKNVSISDSLREKIAEVNKIHSEIIFTRPSFTFDSIRDVLAAIKAELPASEARELIIVPEAVDPNRFVSCVVDLANAQLSIIRLLDRLPKASA